MKIDKYYKEVNAKCQEVFAERIKDIEPFSITHHMSFCIFDFSEHIMDPYEKEMLGTLSSQLESATLSMGLGLYRQAFSSLRLAFEMGLGVAHFSTSKLEHFEWRNGRQDIKWAKLIDSENGVLSKRFVNAFFPELIDWVEKYNTEASQSYREMSEFVHGNYQTWIRSGIVIQRNSELEKKYFENFKIVTEIILFTLCCRYLKSFTKEQLDVMEFISEELSFIAPIRELMGGPKEI